MNLSPQTAEAIYWLAACTIAFIIWFKRSLNSAERAYKRGQEEGRKFLVDGVKPASTAAFLQWRRDTGFYSAFEAGIESVTKEKK